MTRHALDGSRLARIRWPATALLCATVAATVLYAWATPDRGIMDLLSEFRHSWFGTIILIPYIVFCRTLRGGIGFRSGFLGACRGRDQCGAVAHCYRARCAHDRPLPHGETPDSATDGSASSKVDLFGLRNETEVRSIRRAPILGGLGPIAARQALNALRNSLKTYHRILWSRRVYCADFLGARRAGHGSTHFDDYLYLHRIHPTSQYGLRLSRWTSVGWKSTRHFPSRHGAFAQANSWFRHCWPMSLL